MIRMLLFGSILLSGLSCSAQEAVAQAKSVWFGLGVGLDHGGIGIRMDGQVIPSLSVIIGGGYNFASVGWNVGLIYRTQSDSKVSPYITGMYGYNTAIRYEHGNKYVGGINYNGPTLGVGLEIKVGQRESFFHFALLLPIRSAEANEHLLNSRGLKLPVLPSFGFHF